jgi:chromosome transmission fidelity protein 1
MARCVVVVGLPYPDITDPELKEKMNSLDKVMTSGEASPCAGGTVSGSSYYQNLCMRAVNQSVGRAIRHAEDYAAVVLLDQRYERDDRIEAGLPGWLRKGAASRHWRRSGASFDEKRRQLIDFFGCR